MSERNSTYCISVEKIVINQLEGEIQIPEKLDFECSDRSLLVDQLKILQMVLRKEQNKNGNTSSAKELQSKVSSTSSKATNESSTCSENLKDKVERHKQSMIQRRETKLKDMDEEAGALFKSSSEKSNVDQNKVSKMEEELDNLKIVEESIERKFSQEKKRHNSSLGDNEREKKKSKSSHSKYNETDQECVESTKKGSENSQSSSSSKGTSLIETFNSCDSAKSRNEVRQKAIKMMKQQGFEVSVVEPGNFDMRYALSAPYHLFFSRVQKSKATYDQQLSITFPEILTLV